MDFRALAELIMLSLFGLSTFVFAVGLSVRLFLAPTLRELFGRQPTPDPGVQLLPERLTRIEERLESLEHTLGEVADATSFDRALKASSED